MILCGGKGTRLRDVTELLPKPMVPISEQPIIWHIMRCYAAFGVKRFILCLGYKRDCFVDYFCSPIDLHQRHWRVHRSHLDASQEQAADHRGGADQFLALCAYA